MYHKQQPSGLYGSEIGNIAGVGNIFGPGFVIPKRKPAGQPVMPGENPADINSVYGRPGPQPMPNPIQPRLPMAFGGDNFNLNTLLAQVSPGGQNIGNVGGMLGEGPADMTEFTRLLESMQEQNVQNSQREKATRYGRSLGGY